MKIPATPEKVSKPGDFYIFQEAFEKTEELPHFHVVVFLPERDKEKGNVLYYCGEDMEGQTLFTPDHESARTLSFKRAVRFARYLSRRGGPFYAAVAHTDPPLPDRPKAEPVDVTLPPKQE